jgi:hypothetical protein
MISGPAPSRDVLSGFLSPAMLNHENRPILSAFRCVSGRRRISRRDIALGYETSRQVSAALVLWMLHSGGTLVVTSAKVAGYLVPRIPNERLWIVVDGMSITPDVFHGVHTSSHGRLSVTTDPCAKLPHNQS